MFLYFRANQIKFLIFTMGNIWSTFLKQNMPTVFYVKILMLTVITPVSIIICDIQLNISTLCTFLSRLQAYIVLYHSAYQRRKIIFQNPSH